MGLCVFFIHIQNFGFYTLFTINLPNILINL